MIPTIAQVSSLGSPFEKDIEDYAAGQCRSIELWLGKLDDYLERHSIEDVRQLLARFDMSAPVVSFQGGLLTSQGEARQVHWSSFEKRLALCRELGIATLVIVADLVAPLSAQDIDRAQVSLRQAAELAQQKNVRLALEFQGHAPLINNLQTAVAIVDQIGNPHLGICFDVFHYYIGPSKSEDLDLLSPANLFHVQLCDIAGQPRELVTDSDRILPGDGDFLLTPIVDRLCAIDYRGPVSVELMNPGLWQVPARQFGEIAMTALRKTLRLASMG